MIYAWKTRDGNGIEVTLPSGNKSRLGIVWDASTGRDVALVTPTRDGEWNDAATLIAAAPSMLAACRNLCAAVAECGSRVPHSISVAAMECRRACLAAVAENISDGEKHDELLTRAEAAAFLGVAKHTLACWKSEGRGPSFVKFGAGRSVAVRYKRKDVLKWIADPTGTEESASEPWRKTARESAKRRKPR